MDLIEAINEGKITILKQVVTPEKIYYYLKLNVDSSDPDYEELKELVNKYNEEFTNNVKE